MKKSQKAQWCHDFYVHDDIHFTACKLLTVTVCAAVHDQANYKYLICYTFPHLTRRTSEPLKTGLPDWNHFDPNHHLAISKYLFFPFFFQDINKSANTYVLFVAFYVMDLFIYLKLLGHLEISQGTFSYSLLSESGSFISWQIKPNKPNKQFQGILSKHRHDPFYGFGNSKMFYVEFYNQWILVSNG